jgi:hypothetical protein
MVLASDFDKSKYFRAGDLQSEKKFRIKEVTVDEIANNRGQKEDKLVVWFTNDKRGFVLNKTNNRVLRAEFGNDVSGWKRRGHHHLSDDGAVRRQDGAGTAGSYPAA